MATPSKAQRRAYKRSAYLRHTAEAAAARKGGWKVEWDTRKGMTIRLGIA